MASFYPDVTPELQAFIEAQPLFFVATSPLGADGHINLSPKGLDSFRVVAPDRCAYLDLTGSGNETAAHVAENGRVTIMFCAFEGAPNILRIYGTGRVVRPGDDDWAGLAEAFPPTPGARQVIEIRVRQVQTSCGFGVPRMSLVEQRDTLVRWAESKGPEAIAEYQAEKNATSLDGLPAPGIGPAVEG